MDHNWWINFLCFPLKKNQDFLCQWCFPLIFPAINLEDLPATPDSASLWPPALTAPVSVSLPSTVDASLIPSRRYHGYTQIYLIGIESSYMLYSIYTGYVHVIYLYMYIYIYKYIRAHIYIYINYVCLSENAKYPNMPISSVKMSMNHEIFK